MKKFYVLTTRTDSSTYVGVDIFKTHEEARDTMLRYVEGALDEEDGLSEEVLAADSYMCDKFAFFPTVPMSMMAYSEIITHIP